MIFREKSSVVRLRILFLVRRIKLAPFKKWNATVGTITYSWLEKL